MKPSFAFQRIVASDVVDQMGAHQPSAWLASLAVEAKQKAVAPLSRFHVGAAALTSRGDVLIATNVEFDGLSIQHTLHAEGGIFCLLDYASTEVILQLAVTALPCGHCRQLFAEFSDFKIWVEGQSYAASELLPHGFEAFDSAGLTSQAFDELQIEQERLILRRTKKNFFNQNDWIRLHTEQGDSIFGTMIESRAANPSIQAWQVAFVKWRALRSPRLVKIELSPSLESFRKSIDQVFEVY